MGPGTGVSISPIVTFPGGTGVVAPASNGSRPTVTTIDLSTPQGGRTTTWPKPRDRAVPQHPRRTDVWREPGVDTSAPLCSPLTSQHTVHPSRG